MRVRVWIKTFIPGVLFRENGEELTWHARLSPYLSEQEDSLIPFLSLIPSLCFLCASYTTDNRSFSSDINASARFTTVIDIDPQNGIHIKRMISPTTQVRGLLMDLIGNKRDHILHKKAKPIMRQSIEQNSTSTHIVFKSALANPFFDACGIHFSPPAIQEFELILDTAEKDSIKVNLRGRITHFPACEAYLQVEDQEPVCLFQYHPPRGATPFHLFYGWQSIQAEKTVHLQPTVTVDLPAYSEEKVSHFRLAS